MDIKSKEIGFGNSRPRSEFGAGFTFISMLLLSACTFTTTLSESPEFRKGHEVKLKEQIKALVQYSDLIENGATVSVNGKSENILNIVIVTENELPSGKKEVRDLATSIASAYRNALQDPKQYDQYRIEMVSAENSEGVSQRDEVEILIKLSELEKTENTKG